ncbi:unnamed protein product [Thelazia callipaeda]|uniref:Transposase n=1 Tax=Thelazia callipaeda TaxID=103827 RepID=A0A0N5D029_THECL|nr:unnamed protein product [Thelazia callipaeda]
MVCKRFTDKAFSVHKTSHFKIIPDAVFIDSDYNMSNRFAPFVPGKSVVNLYPECPEGTVGNAESKPG